MSDAWVSGTRMHVVIIVQDSTSTFDVSRHKLFKGRNQEPVNTRQAAGMSPLQSTQRGRDQYQHCARGNSGLPPAG